MNGDKGDLPWLRICPHCAAEFRTDGTELGKREPITCPRCGDDVPYTSDDRTTETEPPGW
jgi:hypothetical protein